jgi:hypothetical protein
MERSTFGENKEIDILVHRPSARNLEADHIKLGVRCIGIHGAEGPPETPSMAGLVSSREKAGKIHP